MPATSRQTRSGRTRSASGLAGSPSKSTIFQPLTVRSVWPRWKSPCTRWAVADCPDVPRLATPAKVRRSASACSPSSGTIASATSRRVSIASESAARSLGAPRLGGELLGQHVVHLRGGQAEPLGLAGEVAADLVGVQVGLGEQVAHAGQREVPAVAGGAQELLEHRELDRVARCRRPGWSARASRRARRRGRCPAR